MAVVNSGSQITVRTTYLRGPRGITGVGVPEGGTTGQVLRKGSGDDLEYATLTKTEFGLGNVDNTSDLNKPVSTPQQAALNDKQQVYLSRSIAESAHVPTPIDGVRLMGYAAIFDGGGANYRRVTSEPSHAGKFQSADGAWWELAEAVPNVKMFGARGDYVLSTDAGTNDTTAIGNAWAYALAVTGRLHISRGTYKYDGSTFDITGNLKVTGDGMHEAIIYYKQEGSFIRRFYDGSPGLAGNIDYVELSDFGVWGPGADASLSYVNNYHGIVIYDVNRLTIRNVQNAYALTMGFVARNIRDLTIEGCYVHHARIDPINAHACSNCHIRNNRLEFCDDNAIVVGVREQAEYNTPAIHAVVTGNFVLCCGGIKGEGITSGTFSNNVLMLNKSYGITVGSSGGPMLWGNTNSTGITIADNVILDTWYRTALGDAIGPSPNGIYIEIGGIMQAGSLANIPGWNDTGTGTIIPDYDYFHMIGGGATVPHPGGYGFTVKGNVCARTRPAVANFTDYGLGPYWTRFAVEYDGPVTETWFSTSIGLTVSGGVRDFIVAGNVFSGQQYSFLLTADVRAWNGVVAQNVMSRFRTGAFFCSNGQTFEHNVTAYGNLIDGDPLLTNANRNSDGSWADANGPNAFHLNDAKGFFFRDNRIRNVSRLRTGTNATFNEWQNNIVEAQFAAVGYNASNKGVGNCLRAGEEFRYEFRDCDPTSATYGTILNRNVLWADSMPISGTYMIGHFVRNNNRTVAGSAGSRYIVQGWQRITTGSGHVAGTDWSEMRTLTGT